MERKDGGKDGNVWGVIVGRLRLWNGLGWVPWAFCCSVLLLEWLEMS